MNKQYTVRAVWKEKCYMHFGIHPMTTALYGYKEEDIVELKVEIHEDQSRPEPNGKYEEADYWGWIPEGKDEFGTMVYAQFFLLQMCFPYGVKASEEAGQGKAYRLKIIES